MTLVAEDFDEIVGYAAGYSHRAFYANGSTFWLDEIMVKERYRNEGVGGKLMAEVEN